MISVNGVTKMFGTRTLFEDVNVKFTPGNRYGLTGPNGAGKSTFMKILSGEIEPSNSGTISRPRRVGVLKQDQYAYDDYRIIDTVIMGNHILWEAMQERDRLAEDPNPSPETVERVTELEMIIADENGYMAEIEAEDLLRGIGLREEQFTQPMRSLPTDMKFRVLLAQAMFGEPDALLLDEPTNHMDLDSIHWLEEFLSTYKGALIVVSHDKHFLNAVCTHIADIDYETIILYPGNYDDMVEQKIAARDRLEADIKEKKRRIAQLQEFVAKFSAGSRASSVQSRKKEIQRLQPQELKRSNIQRPYIRFDQRRASGRDVLQLKGISKAFDGRTLFQNLDLMVHRGDKVAIIGGNGVGKTTLVRILIGELEPDAGTLRWGTNTELSYYPQDSEGAIEPGKTVAQWLEQYDHDGEGVQAIRSVLGRMLFAGDDGLKPTAGLSGGERARLLLSKMMLEKHSVLIFDEPTNHLDLEAVNALGEGLNLFQGTVFLVSHDRDLISDAATRILAFTEEGLIDFKGTYEEYLEKHPLEERMASRDW